jgi:Pili and flagellar-assembly chaperone, PapD N-terminal domain
MFIRKIIMCLFLAITTASVAADQQMKPRMGISPSKIEVELDEKGASESITVLNVSDKDLEIQVTVSNWELDENNKVKTLPPEEHSLDRWIIVNPLRFTIPGGESQTVRFAIRPLAKPKQGEYRAMIYFTEILQKALVEEQGFKLSFKFGVPIYAYVGDKIIKGRLLDSLIDSSLDNTVKPHDAKQIKAKFRIINDGNVNIRLSGSYAIWRDGKYPGEQLASTWIEENVGIQKTVSDQKTGDGKGGNSAEPLFQGQIRLPPVFPGNDRWVAMPFQKPEPGIYHMLVVGKIAEKPLLQYFQFTI